MKALVGPCQSSRLYSPCSSFTDVYKRQVESLVFATALLILVFIFLFRAVTVSGTSMVPTLYGGDKIIVQSVGYQPRRGDVIVVDGYINYGEPIVKRIIGVGGDEVDIDFETATVTVNGSVLQEPYLGTPTCLLYTSRCV